jgi:hypothetical protein
VQHRDSPITGDCEQSGKITLRSNHAQNVKEIRKIVARPAAEIIAYCLCFHRAFVPARPVFATIRHILQHTAALARRALGIAVTPANRLVLKGENQLLPQRTQSSLQVTIAELWQDSGAGATVNGQSGRNGPRCQNENNPTVHRRIVSRPEMEPTAPVGAGSRLKTQARQPPAPLSGQAARRVTPADMLHHS